MSTKINNNFNLIRLLASLQVLIVHTCNHFGYDTLPIRMLKCFPGVPLFFFISGYLIGGTYIKNHQKGLAVFFRNRALRLYPALIVCTALSVFVAFTTGYLASVQFNVSQFFVWVVGQISFFQFYNPEFMRGYGTGVLNGALWTIAVEIQFYLLTPIIFYLLKNRRELIFILLILSVLVNIYIRVNPNWELLYMKLLTVSFLPWIYMFLIGYFFSHFKQLKENIRVINIWIVLGLYIISMIFIGSYRENAMNSINPIAVLLLSILVFKFSEARIYLPGRIERFIDKYDISYGIYIYHMPVINALLFLNVFSLCTNIIVTVLLTILFAFLSWVLIERSMMRLKK
ncbi:peptidoglycan/LPS O-acetylase OafA/YrhL [Pedobacter africanus]|uniref:Peptidoglycan/LPS O-acetylase OafA/YrhL n=1 Tax=Pedobacter africanus TaxID=151894 RepID=A0ACC6L3T1_9SPHI|nr:acyltransferase [Pedobacter africanus]MDR6786141.1 peptidoglycan/LPS O-acetylase OafA/YrhL [Pedobacter africanus]